VLASLNHPNIAAIYGVEQGAIVMELVEGQNLKGPVPVETAVDYARQKPENDGRVCDSATLPSFSGVVLS
jgi:serine/threonine-protein kinase